MENFRIKYLLLFALQLLIISHVESSVIDSLNLDEFSNRLLFNTIKVTSTRKNATTSGTAYFFDFQTNNPKVIIPVILTNKHVIADSTAISFLLRESKLDKDGKRLPSDISRDVEMNPTMDDWICHTTMDLCALPSASILANFKKKFSSDVYYYGLTEDLIPSQEELNKLGAIETVTMIGYPIGLWDQGNNLPIMRRGNSASHPAIDFNNKPEGLVDIAAYPGSSGSPILLLDKATIPSIQFRSRVWFLGTLWGGPIHSTTGQIQFNTNPINVPTVSVPTVSVPIMTHLGFYIKSKEIFELKAMLFEKYKHINLNLPPKDIK